MATAPLVYILQEEKQDLYKIGVTKNLNRDYEANRQGNHRHLEIYKVFVCDPDRVKQILESYNNKFKGNGWYSIDQKTVNRIIELIRTDVKKEDKK